LITEILQRRLTQTNDDLLEALSTNAAFALGNLAASSNPLVREAVVKSQLVQATLTLLVNIQTSEYLKHALLTALKSFISTSEGALLQDERVLQFLISHLRGKNERLLNEILKVLKRLFSRATRLNLQAEVCFSFELLGGIDQLEWL